MRREETEAENEEDAEIFPLGRDPRDEEAQDEE